MDKALKCGTIGAVAPMRGAAALSRWRRCGSAAAADGLGWTPATSSSAFPSRLPEAPAGVGAQVELRTNSLRAKLPQAGVQAPRVRISAEEVSYSVVIESRARRGDADGAASWLEEMMAHRGVKPNVFAFTNVIACLARKGDATGAVLWLERMIEEGLEPNVYSYTAVLDGCAKAGDAAGAEKWFSAMLEKGVTPNTISYNAVINAHARRGDRANAVAWLNRLRAKARPDEVSYNSAIHACVSADHSGADEAERLFLEMRGANLWPTASTMSALERAMGAQRRDQLCVQTGAVADKALRHKQRHLVEQRKVRPLQP